MTIEEAKYVRNLHIPFFGCFMQQHPNAPRAINQLLLKYNFSTIIELGTHDAGLSTLLALYCYLSKMPASCENFKEPVLYKNNTHHKFPKSFYTFDNVIRDQNAINIIKALGAQFLQYDILTNEKCITTIGSLIQNNGRTLLLCDNGDKVKEFNIYSKFLKKGDIIMSHDFFENDEEFEKSKSEGRWFSCETKMQDIKKACLDNKIIRVHSDIFNECFWFCGMKT
jgi:hypothetical protein